MAMQYDVKSKHATSSDLMVNGSARVKDAFKWVLELKLDIKGK
jgi:hypothetical protein